MTRIKQYEGYKTNMVDVNCVGNKGIQYFWATLKQTLVSILEHKEFYFVIIKCQVHT